MNWSNVRLILEREVRDQLRDRRTLFMIAVLPLLLYPLVGMSMFQVLQFVREQATRVQIIGADQVPDSPPLIEGDQLRATLFSSPERNRLIELTFPDREAPGQRSHDQLIAEARRAVERGECEAVIYFPPDFRRRLAEFQASLSHGRDSSRQPDTNARREVAEVPSPEIYFSTAKEKSQITYVRLTQVLGRWTDEIGRQNLISSHLPESTARPFLLAEHDVADKNGGRDAAVWSKLLPFLLLIWALTGAFYPAVDLCAGEKERGTLETLLSSPAERREIVWGKLLTIMIFSMVTAGLNLLSTGVTGALVFRVLPSEIGPPPLLAPLWLLIALVPMSALFSALCLALAAFARSSKEGQYYLMPLMLVTMPLVVLPMSPGVELSLGNSLIPVSGVVLLLRAMLEGDYVHALPFLPPVGLVTGACCLWAIRWAVDQFNSENVLFRESERLDLGLWLRHLSRDRGDTPSPTAAVMCGVSILLIGFFFSLFVKQPDMNSFPEVLRAVLITQLAVVLSPALFMTVMLARSPRQTLLLYRPPRGSLAAAALLALALHPAVICFSQLVCDLYPVSETVRQALQMRFEPAPPLWQMIVLLALIPAVCEELAFRGFILSGLRHLGHKWQAIAISSLFFGIAHGVMQHSIVACAVGMVIGYLAVQTGSLLPGLVFHLVHNSIPLVVASLKIEGAQEPQWSITALGALLAAGLLYWFHRLPYARTPEEALQDALEHESARVAAS